MLGNDLRKRQLPLVCGLGESWICRGDNFENKVPVKTTSPHANWKQNPTKHVIDEIYNPSGLFQTIII